MTGSATAVERPSDIGRERAVLVVVCVCTVLVVGLVAAMNLAVPLLAASALHPGASALLWIVDLYVLVFASLVIPGGAVGDRWGRRGALLVGLGVVAAGALLSATAPSILVLLAGRVITGVGAALVLPNCVGVIVHATAPERRRGRLAVWGAISGMGGIVGNTGGGALLATGSWRALFWGVVPIAVIALVAAAIVVRPSARMPRRIDLPGTVLLIATLVALLGGIIEAPERGWSDPVVLGALVAAVVLAAAWVAVERRSAAPLLDPALFRIPALTSASLGMLVTWFGSFGLFYLNASLLQYGRRFTVLEAGFATLPIAVPIVIGSRIIPAVSRRLGIATTLAIGFAAIGIGLLGLASAVHAPFVVYAAWLVLLGAGFALALPTLTAELTGALPADQAGVAGGLQSATRELGSALGIAVVGSLTISGFVGRLPAAVRAHDPVPRTVAEALRVSSRPEAIDAAFVDAAAVALVVAAIVALAAGALVVGLARVRGRRALSS